MSAKPETTFSASVNKHLHLKLHREKTNNPYRGGTPDYYYSGLRSELWVEYKFIVVPVRDGTVIDIVNGKNPPLSLLQQEWLIGRFHEGRNVAVIVGCKAGGVILPGLSWMESMTALQFRAKVATRKEVAGWIQRETGEPYDKERSGNLPGPGGSAEASGRRTANLRGPVRRPESEAAGGQPEPSERLSGAHVAAKRRPALVRK